MIVSMLITCRETGSVNSFGRVLSRIVVKSAQFSYKFCKFCRFSANGLQKRGERWKKENLQECIAFSLQVEMIVL